MMINDDNSGIIRSLSERTNKCNNPTFWVEETYWFSVVIKCKTGKRVCLNGINAISFWLIYGDTEFAVAVILLNHNAQIHYRFNVAVTTAVADSMKYDKKRKAA